jgi:hypothetical protein
MCPVCIANAAVIAASATSTGGMVALVAKKLRTKIAGPARNAKDQHYLTHLRGEQNATERSGTQ